MSYWRRFWIRFRRDLASATSEQVIGLLLAVGILFYQIKYGVIHSGEVHASYWAIFWPYVFLVGVLFLWHLARTPYLLHLEDEKRAEGLELESLKLKKEIALQEDAKRNSVSSADWNELAMKFGEPSQFPLRVQYQSTKADVTWYLHDAKYKALCKLAGSMLLKSPNVRHSLPTSIVSEPNAVSRWLNYIKELNRSEYDGHGIEDLDDGTKLVHVLGYISDLGAVSANLCIECSAKEI